MIAAQQEGDTVDFLIANAFFNNLAINVLPLHNGKVLDPAVSHDFDVVAAGTEEHALEAEKKARGWSERMDVLLEDEPFGVVFVNGKWFKLDKVRPLADLSWKGNEIMKGVVELFATFAGGNYEPGQLDPGIFL